MKRKTVVLIPSLNPDKDLVKYVKKLINSNSLIEVIVVNDGSTDSSLSVVENYFSNNKDMQSLRGQIQAARNVEGNICIRQRIQITKESNGPHG